MSNTELHRSLEAILMVVDEPVSEIILAQITETPTEQVLATLLELAAQYRDEGRSKSAKDIAEEQDEHDGLETREKKCLRDTSGPNQVPLCNGSDVLEGIAHRMIGTRPF